MEKTQMVRLFSVVTMVVILLVAETGAWAGLTPLGFTQGQDDLSTTGNVYIDGGVATLGEASDDDGQALTSVLQRSFTLPIGAELLSFDLEMGTGLDNETDVFTASLLELDSAGNPTGNTLLNKTGQSYFYYLDSDVAQNFNETGSEQTSVTHASVAPSGVDRITARRTVQLDLTSLASLTGQDVGLQFALQHNLEDAITTASLSNVYLRSSETVAAPAPGALMLAGIGVGFVMWMRRRQAL